MSSLIGLLKARATTSRALADFGAREADFEARIDDTLQSGNRVVHSRHANREQMRAMLPPAMPGAALGD